MRDRKKERKKKRKIFEICELLLVLVSWYPTTLHMDHDDAFSSSFSFSDDDDDELLLPVSRQQPSSEKTMLRKDLAWGKKERERDLIYLTYLPTLLIHISYIHCATILSCFFLPLFLVVMYI